MTAKGAGARSAWGRAYAPTSAARTGARNAGDRAYASITASGAGARSAWGRAYAPTSARLEVSADEQDAVRGAKRSFFN
jgi:hypothetical protein